eukprot:3100520-Amphidinium_carterae.1
MAIQKENKTRCLHVLALQLHPCRPGLELFETARLAIHAKGLDRVPPEQLQNSNLPFKPGD